MLESHSIANIFIRKSPITHLASRQLLPVMRIERMYEIMVSMIGALIVSLQYIVYTLVFFGVGLQSALGAAIVRSDAQLVLQSIKICDTPGTRNSSACSGVIPDDILDVTGSDNFSILVDNTTGIASANPGGFASINTGEPGEFQLASIFNRASNLADADSPAFSEAEASSRSTAELFISNLTSELLTVTFFVEVDASIDFSLDNQAQESGKGEFNVRLMGDGETLIGLDDNLTLDFNGSISEIGLFVLCRNGLFLPIADCSLDGVRENVWFDIPAGETLQIDGLVESAALATVEDSTFTVLEPTTIELVMLALITLIVSRNRLSKGSIDFRIR